MKLKKLLNVINRSQPVKFIMVDGIKITKSPVICLANRYDRPLIDSLENCKVHSVRHVHDMYQAPENKDYIEITLIGENRHDN